MIRFIRLSTFLAILLTSNLVFSQPTPAPTSKPIMATPTPKLSTTFPKNIVATPEVSRERREQALAKLMEGQRYIWGAGRLRTQSGIATNSKLAKQAFLKAVELDPNLAEAYTALAEIASQSDLEESILLANLATKLNKDNFGGHRMLARLYTIQSGLTEDKLDADFTAKAISSWLEVARLDKRSAEAWAFLSKFYAKTNREAEGVDALQKWLASAQPLDPNFYQRYTNEASLAPEAASVKLGEAYLKMGREKDAVEVLSRAIAENPQDPEAFEMLDRAIANVDSETASRAIESLQQAAFSSPDNLVLTDLLAQLQARAGRIDDATKGLKKVIDKVALTSKENASQLSLSLAEIYLNAERNDEAIATFESALKLREIGNTILPTDDLRNFATNVFEQIIKAQKNSEKFADAKLTIERSRAVFGKDDLFADRQLIKLLQDSGKNAEALIAVRSARKRYALEYSLMSTEASILTKIGKVDEGVAIIKSLLDKQIRGTGPGVGTQIDFDKFNNLLFISSLYTDAKRGKDAILTAKQALLVAQTDEMKQTANLVLSSAQEKSGDIKGSEATLQSILKTTPNNAAALNNLGYFLTERNERLPEALDFIQKAVKIDPTNSSFLDSLGWIYYKLNKFVEAEKYIKESLRKNSDSPVSHEHLGDIYAKQGKLELAKASWRKALTQSSSAEQVKILKMKLKK
jgi:tetratricopeptide (TPR) repeat protein